MHNTQGLVDKKRVFSWQQSPGQIEVARGITTTLRRDFDPPEKEEDVVARG